MASSADDVRDRLRAQIAAIEAGQSTAPGFSEGASCSPSAPEDGPVRQSVRPAVSVSFGSGSSAAEHERGVASDFDRDEAERAFRKIERLACSREQASASLRRRLAREGFEESAAEAAISRALACGLVDDRRYADVLVRSRLSQGRGRRGIVAELVDLGIDPDGVAALASESGDDALEVERALALLDRKPPRAKNRRDGAYRRLAQKGFSASAALTAARLWCEANPE